ncbi:diguanylate cyclase [Sphingomonas sp. AOB5]|uniref:diguanylate cyclase n=1 Tax=Sphingomonas sp. AOB5 TaxID=3034017 RepID=UPI0023FA3386|nr:diguanylate cyclase [Sphingomonas sp. AOB5]MDF7774633.1 diguanylate cyclase [Sphingomonas sp. AOB5]
MSLPRNLNIATPRWIAPGHDDLPDLPAGLASAWRCDLSDESLTWSAGVFDLFGIPQGAKVDRREAVAMYCEESRGLLGRLRSHAIATCGSFTFEAQIRRLNGELRWMRVTADVALSNGRARHLYGTKQDITAEMTAAG